MAIVIGKVRQVDTTMGGSEGEVVLALPNGGTSAHVVPHLGSDFVQPGDVVAFKTAGKRTAFTYNITTSYKKGGGRWENLNAALFLIQYLGAGVLALGSLLVFTSEDRSRFPGWDYIYAVLAIAVFFAFRWLRKYIDTVEERYFLDAVNNRIKTEGWQESIDSSRQRRKELFNAI